MFKKFLIMLLIVMMTVMLGVNVSAQDDLETYVLGVALPFTGSFGTFGQDFERGIDLAVAQMNAELEAAGSSIRFETASADTEQTPEGAARALQSIVQTTGAQVVVGPLTTDEVLGAKQFVDENGVIIVAPGFQRRSRGDPRRQHFPRHLSAGCLLFESVCRHRARAWPRKYGSPICGRCLWQRHE